MLKHIIRPAAKMCGYETIRADEISEPGLISNQVIQHILNDLLVISDLTGKNPNVFYELAIRHAIRKPLIQLIQKGELLPFDIAGTRTIALDHTDLDSVEAVKQQIVQQIQSLEKSPKDQESPISLALDLQVLRSSKDPQSSTLADLVERLTGVQGTVLHIEELVERKWSRFFSELSKELAKGLGKVKTASKEAKELGKEGNLSELNVSIQELYENLTKAISTVLADVKDQQVKLAERIQNKFCGQSDNTTQIVSDAFAKEICKVVTDTQKQEQLLEHLVESFMYGMTVMGEFQRINIENETQKSALELEERIKDSISKVLDEVGKLHKKVIGLAWQPYPNEENSADAPTSRD